MGIDYGKSGYSEDYGFKGFVMKENDVVAEVDNNKIVKINDKAPLYLQRTKNYKTWIEERGADLKRPYVRAIMHHFGLPKLNIVPGVYYVHAASITDKYWVKGEREKIKYEDVMFSNDNYSNAALKGDSNLLRLAKSNTPEMTNIGSYNKGWKIKGGEWYLYKAGSEYNIFSELYVSKLANELGLNAVNYFIDKEFIVCRNFVTKDCCFEPIRSITDNAESYVDTIQVLEKYNLQKEYIDIIFMDAIVANLDRHHFNFGLMVYDDGKIKMAPNYDNNMALFWSGVPDNLERNDRLVNNFIDVIKIYEYKLPELNEGIIKTAYEKTTKEYKTDIRCEDIEKYCMNAYEKIKTTETVSQKKKIDCYAEIKKEEKTEKKTMLERIKSICKNENKKEI